MKVSSALALVLVVMLLPQVDANAVPSGPQADRIEAAPEDTSLCHRTDYGCLDGTGYGGQSVWGSWGPGHNCVSYAAYRLMQNGAARPWASQSIGNANQWDERARSVGIAVNGNPAVGSIAQWDTGSAGHVAYVEAVTASYIEITEDAYLTDTSGYSSRRRLDRTGSTYASAEFIHVKDVTGPPPPVDESTELLPSGSFENGDGGWRSGLGANMVRYQNTATSQSAHDGGWFLATNSPRASASISRDIGVSLAAGAGVTASTWVRSQEASASGTWCVWALNSPAQSSCTNYTANRNWKRIEVVLNPNTATSNIRVELYPTAVTGGTTFLDTVSVTR